MSKAKKQGHGGYMQRIKGHIEVRGKRKPYLELWIQITQENWKKLDSQMKKLEQLSEKPLTAKDAKKRSLITRRTPTQFS